MAKHSSHILELARKGAEARYRELVAETKMLVRSFPHLRDSFDKDELPVSFLIATGSNAATRRRRRGMSTAARKAVSLRMKKYWAARRKAEKD